MSPLSATGCSRTTTRSRSRMPASIMLSPWTSSAKQRPCQPVPKRYTYSACNSPAGGLHQTLLPPCLLWRHEAAAGLRGRLPCVAWAADRLPVRGVQEPIRRVLDWHDVIDLRRRYCKAVCCTRPAQWIFTQENPPHGAVGFQCVHPTDCRVFLGHMTHSDFCLQVLPVWRKPTFYYFSPPLWQVTQGFVRIAPVTMDIATRSYEIWHRAPSTVRETCL